MSNLKTISMSSSKLLLAAKALTTDPSSPNLKNQLAAAARWQAFLSSLSTLLKQRELCLPILLNCLSVFYTSLPLCPQGSDRQYQPAHHHVHSAGSRSEGVWQCSQRAGGNNHHTTIYHVSLLSPSYTVHKMYQICMTAELKKLQYAMRRNTGVLVVNCLTWAMTPVVYDLQLMQLRFMDTVRKNGLGNDW